MKIALPNLTLNYVQLTYTSAINALISRIFTRSLKFSNIFDFSKANVENIQAEGRFQ